VRRHDRRLGAAEAFLPLSPAPGAARPRATARHGGSARFATNGGTASAETDSAPLKLSGRESPPAFFAGGRIAAQAATRSGYLALLRQA